MLSNDPDRNRQRDQNSVKLIRACEKAIQTFKKDKGEFPVETPVSAAYRKVLTKKYLYSQSDKNKFIAAVTRWLFTQRLYDETNSDPILSQSNEPDVGFAIYLKETGKSNKIEERMKELVDSIYDEIDEHRFDEYNLALFQQSDGTQFTLTTSTGFKTVEFIHAKQMEKLSRLYKQHNNRKNMKKYHDRVFMYSCLYSTSISQGYQGALPPSLFTVLQRDFEVDTELFASPLNSTLPNFYSAFPVIDKYFGSKGTFFENYNSCFRKGGSFECNPPFTEEYIYCVAKIINTSFSKYSDVPLSVVLVLPSWEDSAGFPLLFDSIHKRLFLSLRRKMHQYAFKSTNEPLKLLPSNANSHLFILQNDLGAKTWPVTRTKVKNIIEGFRG